MKKWRSTLKSVSDLLEFLKLMESLAKTLVLVGLIIAGFGLVLLLFERVSFFPLGRLPGDIRIESNGFAFYFPWVTFLLLSVVATVILNLILRFISK